MIATTNIQQAKNQIKSAEKPIVIQAQSPEFNRKILEYGKFQVLLFPEKNTQKKDRLKSLDAGINHVLAKIAAKNKVAIGLNLSEISRGEKKEKAIQLARIAQLIKTCRRAKCKISLLNAKDSKNAQALLQSLGASSQQTKN